MSGDYKALIELIEPMTGLQPKDVDEWHEAMRVAMKDGSTINFKLIPDDSDLVMRSIFKNVADECHSQAKELTPNGVKFGPYEEVKGPPPAHLFQPCTTTPTESKMGDVKTVTHDGNVYQIGKNYLLSDNGTDFSLAKLVGIKKTDWPFQTNDGDVFKYIHEMSALKNIGTITPEPVPLIHGKAYTFDYTLSGGVGVTGTVGIFDKRQKCFAVIGRSVAFEDCKNIRPMAVVEDAKS